MFTGTIYGQHNGTSKRTIIPIVERFGSSCSVEDRREQKYSPNDRKQEIIDLFRTNAVEEHTCPIFVV